MTEKEAKIKVELAKLRLEQEVFSKRVLSHINDILLMIKD